MTSLSAIIIHQVQKSSKSLSGSGTLISEEQRSVENNEHKDTDVKLHFANRVQKNGAQKALEAKKCEF